MLRPFCAVFHQLCEFSRKSVGPKGILLARKDSRPNGVSMDHAWTLSGMCVQYASWGVNGICTEFEWNTHGMCMNMSGNVWNMYGPRVKYRLHMHGICMQRASHMYAVSIEHARTYGAYAWHAHGIRTKHAFHMRGLFMQHAWNMRANMHGIYIGHHGTVMEYGYVQGICMERARSNFGTCDKCVACVWNMHRARLEVCVECA